MGTLGQEADQYEPPKTKNISELEKVSVDAEIVEKEYEKSDGSTFKLKVIVVDGEDYRVPTSVLKALKTIREEKPELKFLKVKKTGEGLKTEYTIVTLD
jgi:hypothetical protein|tara:strand:- start:2616 stop:2912 length:297 start_codon:yes stop_codon:yes gene_type:complete